MAKEEKDKQDKSSKESENQKKKKSKSRNPIIKFNKLQMFFGEPYVIDLEGVRGSITIYTPTVYDVVKMGEEKLYSTVSIFTTNTTSYRLVLWKMDLDWNNVSDFQLFMMLYQGIDKDVSKLLFGDLDWSLFEPYSKELEDGTQVPVLYNTQDDIEITEEVYFHISQYVREIFNIFPEEKFTTDAILKKWFISKDEKQLENESKKEDKNTSTLLPLMSACLNHPGFKYDLDGLKKMNMCCFYDSVKRLQVYENTTAVLKGMFSGFCDTSKIKPEEYNFMKDI